MGGGSLAIVEKKPPFGSGVAGGCAGGVLFHLLDWHRRLARKRRLFSPRRLLPSAARSSSTRRLPPPPPSPAPPPLPAPTTAGRPASAAPGVVARLMGLESWPGAPPAAPRPQKQRKVDAAPAPATGDEDALSSVVVMLPPSRRPPAHAHARSHHSADLPARSPRRARIVHAAATRLLEPAGARGGSRARLAYACSSPQHRGHSGGTLQDFLSRSDSLCAPPADTDQDNAGSARWQQTQHSIEIISGAAASSGVLMSGSDTIVVPRLDSGDANTSRGSSDLDALPKDSRERTRRAGSYSVARSANAATTARTGEQRLLRKRGTFSRPDLPRSIGSENMASSTRSTGNARDMSPGGSSRRAAHNSGPRRESTSPITPQRSNRRDVIDRNGSASTSRNASNASGPRRGSRKKIDRGTACSNYREDHNAAAFASSSCSRRPVSRASPLGNDSEKRRFQSVQSDTSCARVPAVGTSPSSVPLSEKEEFSRLLKAKINELGLSDKVEPSDDHSANLTASLLQELISALTTDTNTSASRSSNYSDSSAPLNSADTLCNFNDQSPEFHKRYQGDQEADFSVTCTNDEPNQPSPTSVLEACFSNDASSLGSPVQKDEGKEFFVSMENKMEELFNLDSDIVDLSMSIDTIQTDAHCGSGEIPCVGSFAAHDFNSLEGRLHSIGEAIANAELLLDSSLFCGAPSGLSLHSFIVEMLEAVEGFCGGPEGSGFKEEDRYQRTNFLFDCIVESLDLKFRNFGKCGYKAWLRLPLALSKDVLKREVSEEIGSWMDTGEEVPLNFNLTWEDITNNLKPVISNPWTKYKLSRNPRNVNAGNFMKLSDFLAFAKDKDLSGIMITVERASFMAEKLGFGVVDAVIKALDDSGYSKQTTQKVMIQSANSSTLVKFKQQAKYNLVYMLDEDVKDAAPSSVADIKKFADAVSVSTTSIYPSTSNFLLNQTSHLVKTLQAAGLPVYAHVLMNEFISQPYDFFSDATAQINAFVQKGGGGGGVDGVITDFPATAHRYKLNSCMNLGDKAPYYMQPPQRGGLLSVMDNAAQPPAMSPMPFLTDSDVEEPALPPVSSTTPSAPSHAVSRIRTDVSILATLLMLCAYLLI